MPGPGRLNVDCSICGAKTRRINGTRRACAGRGELGIFGAGSFCKSSGACRNVSTMRSTCLIGWANITACVCGKKTLCENKLGGAGDLTWYACRMLAGE